MKYLLLYTILSFTTLFALSENMEKLSKELNLSPGSKASVQWERVFSSKRHLRHYKLDSLPLATRNDLKKYLIKHAADSDQPIVPGL